ncbi:MAG: hypothetical protein Rhirs2KO_18380 [Rhizobiaceae bacterium]
MNRVLRPSDEVALVGVIDPDAYAASTVTTGWIAAKNFEKFLAIIKAGDLGASATLDAKLEQAQDGSGTGAKDITGKSITQLTKAGSDDNKQSMINLVNEELDVTNGFTHFRLSMTIGTAASDAEGEVLGLQPRYAPASDNDISTVDEIVA